MYAILVWMMYINLKYALLSPHSTFTTNKMLAYPDFKQYSWRAKKVPRTNGNAADKRAR